MIPSALLVLTFAVLVGCVTAPDPAPQTFPLTITRTVVDTDPGANLSEAAKKSPRVPSGWDSQYRSEADGIVRYSFPPISDDQTNLQVLDLLRTLSPEEARLFENPAVAEDAQALKDMNMFINMEKVKMDFKALLITPKPDFDPVKALPIWVHEAYHQWILSPAGHSARYFLDKSLIYTVPVVTTPPARDSAHLLPARLKEMKGSRKITTYIDPPEGAASLQVCQVDGLYGILNEYTAYFHSARTTADLLTFYQDSGNFDFPGVQRLFGTAQNELTAQAEFRLFLLNHLLYIRTSDPGLYAQLRALEPLKDLVAELGRRSPGIMVRLQSQVQAVIDLYGEPRLQQEWTRGNEWYSSYRPALERETSRPELTSVRAEWGL